MPGDEYARNVVSDLLSSPRPRIWRGRFATLVWFIMCFGWVGMLVSHESLAMLVHHDGFIRCFELEERCPNKTVIQDNGWQKRGELNKLDRS